MKVSINGELVDKADAKISVFDHGFLYGDGVFEGIRLYSGNVFMLDEHLERLFDSAKAIGLKLTKTPDEIAAEICRVCLENGLSDGYIRLVVTRGEGHLGLSPVGLHSPNTIIIADTIQLYPAETYTKGLAIITVPTRRINPAALPPMVKSLNYLNNILAKMEAQQAGFHEAIMLNDQGYVAECTGDNIFAIRKNVLFTPPTYSGALKGITREVVLKIASELGVKVVIEEMTRYDFWVADECFLTGTAAEIIPVVEIDGRVIGAGKPGRLTDQFLRAFRERVARDGVRINQGTGV
ncbi:MAG: branched-chain-amino-acid transaminase [Puniceicoccaceae bacterium]